MWQGVPFKFLSGDVPDLAHIAISKLPHVMVESTPDYLGALTTFFGALAAGCITAYVAWSGITANKKQMLQQQMIINRQKFIDEIRVKISSFLADVEKLSLMLEMDNLGHQLTMKSISHASKAELNDLAHRLDLSYYHILLMIDKKPQFEEMVSLIEQIKDKINNSVRNVTYYDIEPISMKLIDVTIKSIESEWSEVTRICK